MFKTGTAKFATNNFFRGRGGRSFYKGYRKSGKREPQMEKLINFEMIGVDKMAVSFQGFLDTDLKDLIKAMPNSSYDNKNKIWIQLD